jgi:hypothetical protein
MSESESLKPNEVIALINDFERAPGVREWFFPEVDRRIRMLEESILDEATPTEITSRMKMERAIWLEVKRIPQDSRKAQQAKMDEITQSVGRGIMRE